MSSMDDDDDTICDGKRHGKKKMRRKNFLRLKRNRNRWIVIVIILRFLVRCSSAHITTKFRNVRTFANTTAFGTYLIASYLIVGKRLIFLNRSHEQISFPVVCITWNLLPRKLWTKIFSFVFVFVSQFSFLVCAQFESNSKRISV